MSASSAKVYVRVRPFLPSELCPQRSNGGNVCSMPVVEVTGQKTLVYNPSSLKEHAPVTMFSTIRTRMRYDQQYQFEGVFDMNSSDTDVFKEVAVPSIEDALQGKNSTIFAYGATGCGKSHTVSAINSRTAPFLFSRLLELGSVAEYRVKVSYVELYNEKLIDLLPSSDKKMTPFERVNGLGLRDSCSGTGIIGLCEHSVSTPQDIINLCSRGDKARRTAATNANAQSSRSHAVFTIHVEYRFAGQSNQFKRSSITIMDLAGSERAQSTQNRGKLLAEGAKINQSLLALGKCINARARKQRFVPYRDSKLTRLLRSSLQGTCTTTMIVCVSPSILNFDETHYSLEYAQRTSCVQKPGNNGNVNANKGETKQLSWLISLVSTLQQRNSKVCEQMKKRPFHEIPVSEFISMITDKDSPTSPAKRARLGE